jgi:hypothetical protein
MFLWRPELKEGDECPLLADGSQLFGQADLLLWPPSSLAHRVTDQTD